MEKIRIEVVEGVTIEVDESIAKKAILSVLGLDIPSDKTEILSKKEAIKEVSKVVNSGDRFPKVVLAEKLYQMRQRGMMPKDIAEETGIHLSKVNYSIANYKAKLKRQIKSNSKADLSTYPNQSRIGKLEKFDKVGKLVGAGNSVAQSFTNVFGRAPCSHDYYMLKKLGYIE